MSCADARLDEHVCGAADESLMHFTAAESRSRPDFIVLDAIVVLWRCRVKSKHTVI